MTLFLTHFKALNILLLTHFLNRDILLNASAILLVSSSAAGADKLDEPKLDKSKAKKRLRTCKGKSLGVTIHFHSNSYINIGTGETHKKLHHIFYTHD